MTEIACSAELPDDWFELPVEEGPEEFGRRFGEVITRDLRDELQVELAAEQTVDLLVGPAVRVHKFSVPPAEDPADRRAAVEKVMHLPREGAVAVLTMTWPFLALADQLTPMADGIAASLDVTR